MAMFAHSSSVLRKKRILIADDHLLIAEGLAGLLASEYEIAGMAADGRELLQKAAQLRPELVILDISMPELNGIEAARQLHRMLPLIKMIFVTQQLNALYLRAAFQAGAHGYVAKQCASDDLRVALGKVLAGGTYISPLLQEKVGFTPVAMLRRSGTAAADELTGRQREVLQLLTEGKTSREIATAIGISPKTVEFHKRALMDQTGLRTTAELTKYAIASGVVAL